MQSYFWIIFACVSAVSGTICLYQSDFIKLQFEDTKLSANIFITIVTAFLLAAAFVSFYKADKIREINRRIADGHFASFGKIVVESCVFFVVNLVQLLVKYPRFKKSNNQEKIFPSSMNASRLCFQKIPDAKISALCSHLLEQKSRTQHGDWMGFCSVASFSVFAFSISRLLKLPWESGLFYMLLEFTMSAAMDIPGHGGSIVSWKLVSITISCCFLLIVLRNLFCYYDQQSDTNRFLSNDLRNLFGGAGGRGRGRDDEEQGREPSTGATVTSQIHPVTIELAAGYDGDHHEGREAVPGRPRRRRETDDGGRDNNFSPDGLRQNSLPESDDESDDDESDDDMVEHIKYA